MLATTTSTEDSGLLGELVAAFEAANPPYTVEVVAVGTGAALDLGRRGDADLVMVHDPAGEEAFVAGGYGTTRCVLMMNDFVIVGPPDDPAEVRQATTVEDALRRIVDTGVEWVSRGDDSGTHRRERALWDLAHTRPPGTSYVEVGQGMGSTLTMTSERRSYTLSDRSTFEFMRDGLELEIVYEREPPLENPYAVIPVTDAANPAGAGRLAAWLVSEPAQALIERYGVERFGMPLFTALRPECAFGA
ncbi:MAG TPA: substrate-binding domain-containing protein [Longimicrobiales bacterium]|nr:substrate-binding domain-containing protein [Longimicrobiales bacterium]